MENFEQKWNGLTSDNPKLNDALDNFDVEQYKKDMDLLKLLTGSILKNNPLCVTEKWMDSWDGSSHIKDLSKNQPKKDKITGPITEADQEIWKQFDGEKFVFDKDWHEKQAKIKVESKKDPSFQKEVDDSFKKSVDKFGRSFVGDGLSKEILEKSKEKILDEPMPGLAKDLQSLGLYGVYVISDNKFTATYMDFVESEVPELKDDMKVNPDLYPSETMVGGFWKKREDVQSSLDKTWNISEFNNSKNIELRVFDSVGRMNERFISLADTRLEIGIKDFINAEFIKKVKELTEKNLDDAANNIKKPLIVKYDEKDDNSKICNKLTMVSNYIFMKNKSGKPTFIFASKKNISLINDSVNGYWWKDGKTYKYNKTSDNFNYNLIANDDLGDTVIMGKLPKEGEVGINLVINKTTLTNYEYSDDDITGVNISFDFFAFGNHPEWNYFRFDMKKNEVEELNPEEFFDNTLADRLIVKIDGENQSLKGLMKTGYDELDKINS